jgi:hypothetical protein
VALDLNHGEGHFGKVEVRNAHISRFPKCERPEVLKCRYSSGSSDSKGHVAPDPRNHDFMTQRF